MLNKFTNKIAAIGDSITWGYPYGRSWTHLLEASLNISIYNAGLNGDTLEGMYARMESVIEESSPDFCIVMGGTNDVWQGLTSDAMIRDAEKIRQVLKENEIEIIWGIPAPIVESYMNETLEVLRDWMRKSSSQYIPFDRAFYTNDKLETKYLPDGVHPSDAGYQRMYEVARPVIERLL